MLCVTNPQFLPSAWNAYMHGYHKVLLQAEESFLKGKSHRRKHKNRRKLDGVSHILNNVPVQPSYVDRMIPAVTILGAECESILRTNSRRFLGSGNSPFKPFLRTKSNFRQIRTFKLKVKGMNEEYSANSKRLLDEDVLELAKQATKSLNFNSRETISYCLGLQEGINIKSKEKQAKDSFLSRYGLTALVVGALAYMGYRVFTAVSVDRDDVLESMNQRDFQAEIPDVSFDDVKGIEEVKQELQDVVEFLKDPEKFTVLGGKLPKGILLSGPPGTGKTLLARAVAGEAGVPFYYASGSEFDEMFVGIGSARIRSLFADAKENSPCIIFIDEIDACGSARTTSPLQPYARQTINQLLQEMDGFQTNDSVIVLAATNMKDVLDKALTRPGRFDTEVTVMLPDLQGRIEILQLYVDRIVHGNDLDLEKIARLTGGMTGAALSNLVNQAALRAGHLNKTYTQMCDFEYALDKLRMGPELKSRIPTESELELTAFHEAGHALIAFYSPHTMPIYKATVNQRGAALGHVSMVPTREDESGSTSAKLLAQIDVCMGGRVAEEILRGKDHATTGASSDLQVATRIAFEFVCTYGMSEGIGFVAVDYENVSPETKRKIEMEVRKLLENSYKKVKNMLSMHSHQHKLLAKALIKYQTLTLEEIKTLLSTQNIKSIEKLRSSVPSSVSKSSQVKGNKDGIPSPI